MILAIIWRGWGILAVLIPAVPVLTLQLLAESLFGEGTYQQNSEWLFGLGLLIASPIIWLVGRRLNRVPTRQLVDQATGESVTLRKRHTMFFIKLEYWAFIFAAISAVLIFNGCQPASGPEITTPDAPPATEEVTETAPDAELSEGSPAEEAPAQEDVPQNTVQRDGAEEAPLAASRLTDEPAQTQFGPDSAEVDLMAAKVTGDIMTVTLRYRSQPNASLATRYPVEEVSYIDDATSTRYGVVQDESGNWLAAPKNAADNISINIYNDAEIAWFKFPAPPPEAETISITIPEVSPFDGVAIER